MIAHEACCRLPVLPPWKRPAAHWLRLLLGWRNLSQQNVICASAQRDSRHCDFRLRHPSCQLLERRGRRMPVRFQDDMLELARIVEKLVIRGLKCRVRIRLSAGEDLIDRG